MTHAVKCLPEYFAAAESGLKSFEVRKNDRSYKVGDYLALNEFVKIDDVDMYSIKPSDYRVTDGGYYTGKTLIFEITYILDSPQYCAEGMVILALRKIDCATVLEVPPEPSKHVSPTK